MINLHELHLLHGQHLLLYLWLLYKLPGNIHIYINCQKNGKIWLGPVWKSNLKVIIMSAYFTNIHVHYY